jgi:hypothetical protein
VGLVAAGETSEHCLAGTVPRGGVPAFGAPLGGVTGLALTPGRLAVGTQAIRRFYTELLASPPRFTGVIRPAIRNGDIAVTSTTRAGNATVEVARRQPDGTWLWIIDQPNVLE